MAGMYIYGLSMGIPFDLLALLLMSDIGNVISSYLNGSIITDKLNLTSIESVIKYLKDPSIRIQFSYGSERLSNGGKVWNSLSSIFNKEYNSHFGKEIKDAFSGYSVNNLFALLDRINKLRNKFTNNPDKYLYNRTLDVLEDAIISKAKILLTPGAGLNDFLTLHKGAAEFKILGLLLGANQGVKNTLQEYFGYIKAFETATSDMVTLKQGYGESISGNVKRVDFKKFMDSESYRQEVIEEYDSKAMLSFNPYKVLLTVPQYNGYLHTVYTKHNMEMRKSIKWRTLYDNLLINSSEFDKLLKSLENLVDYKLINNYFLTLGKNFILPKGLKIVYLENKNMLEATVDTPTNIFLGTLGGNATFKNWMELEVIPNLKNGYNSSDKSRKNPSLFNNEFIKSLRPNKYTHTASKNPTTAYATNIKMSRKTEEEILAVDKLRYAFDNLRTGYTTKDANGNDFTLPIKDLFYWYNLITYNGKLGLSTLTSIFDNYEGESKNFRKATRELDKREGPIAFTSDELSKGIALVESPYSSNSGTILYKNKDTLEVELMTMHFGTGEDGDRADIGKFDKVRGYDKIDLDLFTHRPSKDDVVEYSTLVQDKLFKFTYNPVTRKFGTIKGEDIELEFPMDILTMYNPNTGAYDLTDNDFEIINSAILQKLNC